MTHRNCIYSIFFLSLFFAPQLCKSQVSPADSSVFAPMVQTSYQAQFPMADLEDRFGFHSQLGVEFHIKTKSNFFFGIKGGFIFGDRVNEKGLLDNISTGDEAENSAFVISQSGARAEVFMDLRGFSGFFTGGKMFNILAANPNSGVLIQGGIGFLQHKIRYHWSDYTVPPLEGDYMKGYDRLCRGPAIEGQIGYFFLGNNRLVNFYIGGGITYAQTKNKRGYNYNVMGPVDGVREDIYYSLKASWILPLYKPAPREYYYY